ncbi:MAG: branched-chain amino acid ABC transporter permease [Candidatus Lambdaproteobacteria bacterium]|nr:branched-chain amino acid ABC transporter permease [Candidatus Lambdaproteobacteria bacterium]
MKRTLPFVVPTALLLALPLLRIDARDYVLQVLTLLFLNIVLAQSYDMVGGTMGYINLGHIAFFGLGAYALGILYNAGVPFVPAVALAVLAVMAFAALISYPFFRLRGAYFALAAFGLVKLMEYVTINLNWLTGGSNGLKIDPANRTVPMYLVSLAVVVIVLLASWVISRSRLGLAMKSIREDEEVARDFGVPTRLVKTQALVVSSIFPAVMGAFYTWYINFIDPGQVFGLKIALTPVAMAMLGGSGLVIGPVVGAIVLYMAEEVIWTQFDELHGAMLGGVIVVVGLFMPGGLMRLRPLDALLGRLGWREDDR